MNPTRTVKLEVATRVALAVVVPVLLRVGTYGAAIAVGARRLGLDIPLGLGLAAGLVIGAAVVLGEEIGRRGHLPDHCSEQRPVRLDPPVALGVPRSVRTPAVPAEERRVISAAA